MAYNHGIITSEVPTSLVAPVRIEAGLPFVIGTAPIHLSGELENVNKPVLCYSYAEFVKAFGFSKDWEKYTLCEFAYSQFVLHNVAPVVFVNVLDPAKHFEKVDAAEFAIDTDGQIDLGLDVIASKVKVASVDYTPASSHEVTLAVTTDYTVSTSPLDSHSFVKVVSGGGLDGVTKASIAFEKNDGTQVPAAEYEFSASGQADIGEDVNINTIAVTKTVVTPAVGTEYALADDFILTYDDDGHAILTVVPGGNLVGVASVKVSLDRIDASAVDDDDIIGGVDSKGNNTGLMLVEDVYPKFRLTVGLIAAPKFSQSPTVAAVMRTRAESVNGVFSGGLAVVDIPSDKDGAANYTDVPEWKTQHNLMSEYLVCCWPKVRLGDYEFHLSTQLIGIMNKVDAEHDDIPYKSPSNELLQIDSCVNALGEEINLGVNQAAYLNGQGVITAINFANGWVSWGNRTACYPGNTDPKDNFIAVRRMFTFLRNEFTLTFWKKIDNPISRRLIKVITDSYQTRLNSLQAMEAILGGRIEFTSEENALTDLIDGILHFHIYVTPPTPAKEIQAAFEFDPDYFNTLFE